MQKLLGNLKKGLFFILSAPAGTGKTTLVNMLEDEFSSVVRSISFTTRNPRKGEVNGIDYFFVTKEEFEKKIQMNDFLEYALVFDDYYGTSKTFVEEKRNEGKNVVLVIDTQGAMKLKEKNIATLIFVTPPSVEVLKERLLKRNTDSLESIEKRLSWANEEIKLAKNYDYIIVNDELQVAYQILRSILIAEEHRTKRK
jgi:guanylate kinase